jgi:predicted nucleotidyltransferase
MQTLETLLPILRDAKVALMAKYPITEMGVFGSYVRGEAQETSDLDILLDYDLQHKRLSAFDILDMETYLSQKTGIDTHIASKAAVMQRKYTAPYIFSEVRVI